MSSTVVHPASVVITSDVGQTWTCRSTPEQSFIRSIAFAKASVGWAAGASGVLYTEDGGVHWIYQLQSTDDLFVDVCIVDHSSCWVLGFKGRIYRYDIP